MTRVQAEPFRFQATRDGRVRIWRGTRLAATLAGVPAERLLARIDESPADAQVLLARATGQYRFGNERSARATRSARRSPKP
jgi:hypothetical protein